MSIPGNAGLPGIDPSSDLMTWNNFDKRLPQWRPNLKNHRFAVVDIGSNGIRFSVSDLSPQRGPRLLTTIFRERTAISLYDALNDSRDLTISDEIVNTTCMAIVRFRLIARGYGVPDEHFIVIATAALREAANRKVIIDTIKAEAGATVHLLDTEMESVFGAMGSRSAFPTVAGGLFLDLGGGSVQMAWVDTTQPLYEYRAAKTGESRKFGAAKMTRILEMADARGQLSEKELLRNSMREAYGSIRHSFPGMKQKVDGDGGVHLFLSGGGFRGYGAMLLHSSNIQPYPLHQGPYMVTGDRFRQTQAIRQIHETFEGKIFGMSKRRRRQFPAILEVVEALVEAVPNIITATFCPGSNREGALFMILPHDVRNSNPLTISGADQNYVELLARAMPQLDTTIPTIFSLDLTEHFVRSMTKWPANDGDSNASACLHDVLSRFPDPVGLTHIHRAVLAIALCTRWGGVSKLAPADQQVFNNLKRLANEDHPAAAFWAEYVGGIAHVLGWFAAVAPVVPGSVVSFVPRIQGDIVEVFIRAPARVCDAFDTHKVVKVLADVRNKTKEGNWPRRVQPRLSSYLDPNANVTIQSLDALSLG